MSANGGLIKFHVPEGFLPMSMPVKSEDRIPTNDIRVEVITKDDLLTIARGLHAAFPEVWWTSHEPLDMRPSKEIREQRLAKRLEAFVLNPHLVHSLKAVDVKTGELMGFAGWHVPVPKEDFVNMWSVPSHVQRGLREQPGWSQEDVEEMWKGVLTEKYNAEFDMYDKVRAEEMGDEQHWFLAPLFVFEQFRGRGVGSLLMQYAIDLADRHDPPQAMVLEAMPNARPVYMHYGFEPPESFAKKPNRETLLIRRPQKKST